MTTMSTDVLEVQVLEAVCRHLWQRDPRALVEVLSARGRGGAGSGAVEDGADRAGADPHLTDLLVGPAEPAQGLCQVVRQLPAGDAGSRLIP